MKKDLSKVENSVTAVFERLLPNIESIKKDSSLDMEDKLRKAQDICINELIKARNTGHQISADRLSKDRVAILRADNIDKIIQYMKKVIKNGKNYDTKNTIVRE